MNGKWYHAIDQDDMEHDADPADEADHDNDIYKQTIFVRFLR